MSPRLLLLAGIALLLFAWAGPLPRLVPGSLAAHMTLHMLVVGIGAPLLAFGLAPHLRPKQWPLIFPLAASLLDLIVVWLWHVPALHHAARTQAPMLALEQGTFAAVALLLWLVAITGPPLIGALTLFFTSMHMTLLGALLGLGSRIIYPGHGGDGWLGLTPLADQQLGGAVMLTVGAVVYLGGGLHLAARVFRPAPPA